MNSVIRMAGEGACLEATSDGELIRRTGRGDQRAFDVLYRRHSGRVFNLALRKLHDRGRAEDVAQETFAAIWRSAASYRPERGPGGPWLYAVARNAIVDRIRARTDMLAEPSDLADDGPGPSQQAENEWLKSRVHAAIEQLPERERSLIALAYWKGLSQSEIAAHADLPLGTVKTRIRTALARLADILEGEQLL
jgi:RNA polymerase sigma-70 factor, ECF subfamily